jgi:hypothetical protein
VKKINYVQLLKTLLKTLQPDAPVPTLKSDVVAALCDEDCGSMEQLRTGAAALEEERVELAASVRTVHGLHAAVTAGRRDGAAAEAREAAELVDDDYEHTECFRCKSDDFAEEGARCMLLCEGCPNGWHMGCLKPALDAVPRGDWYCPGCA